MSSTSGSRRGPSRRSRYQSISARSVSRNSRINLVTCSSSSRGAARRMASSRANSADGSSGRPYGGGGGLWSAQGSSVRCACIGAPLEHDLQRAVLEAGAARRVPGHGGRQLDRSLLGADPNHHLESDLLQLELLSLRERERQAQPGAPVVGGEFLGDLVVQDGRRIVLGEDRGGQPVEHLGSN